MSTALIDMDGVVASFVEHALMLHGRPGLKITHWNLESQLGLTKKQFQKPINAEGYSFWADMPELRWWKKVWHLANQHFDNVFFLSSPAEYKAASHGKTIWLQRRLGRHFNKFVFTQHKHLCAKPNTVLIDDNELNCENFDNAGGISVLFPAAWNSLGEMNDPIPYLERQLKDAAQKIRAYEDWEQLTEHEETKDEDWHQFLDEESIEWE